MKLDTIKQTLKREKFTIILFAIGYIFTILEAFYGVFGDEADVISASWLMSQGKHLYSDIFCHHMPVPYFFLEIFQYFSNSVIFLRLSYGIVTQSFFILLYIFFRKKLPHYVIPLTAALWGMMRHIFLQNMILADTFVALGLFTIFLEMITHKEAKYERKDKILISFATFISFGSSLIAVYPLMIFYLYYIGKRIALYIKEKENALSYFKEDICFMLIVLCPFLVFILYFIITGTWGAFLENGIFFNTDYYSIYNEEATPVSLVINQFLDFPAKAWVRVLFGTKYLPLGIYSPTDIFTGMSFVIFFVWSIVSLFRYKQKAILYILFVYFCYMRDGFHICTFMIFCQYFVAEAILWCMEQMRKKEKGKMLKAIAIAITFVYSAFYIFIIGLSIFYMIKDKTYVTDYGKEYREVILAVTEEEDTIWAVPLKPELYFVTRRQPANGNIFYLPWQSIKPGVNEKIEEDIRQKKPTVIVYDAEESLWGGTSKPADYCGWLENILNENYFTIQGLDKIYFLKEQESEIIEKLIENNIVRREENGEIVCSNAGI